MPHQDSKPGSDGLPALVQGSWSQDKLHFVAQFANIFNKGMKDLWPARAYVDLFAGPGLCLDRESGMEFRGSPMLALGCKPPFTRLYLNDRAPGFVAALKQRQEREFPDSVVSYSALDCNEAAAAIAARIPRNALVLCFIDPWTYEITFDSIASLCEHPFIDLIVTFQTTAIKRNARHEIESVNRFLGGEAWRSEYIDAEGDPSRSRTHVLIDAFTDRLRKRLGFRHFGRPQAIRNTAGAPMFYVLFASRHPRGLDFWSKSSAIMRSGQRSML